MIDQEDGGSVIFRVRLLNLLALLALCALAFAPPGFGMDEGVPPRVAVELNHPGSPIPPTPQTPTPSEESVPSPLGRRPRLFISCLAECFLDYLKQELSYFDFVRDRFQSDFVVLIVRQPAENNGERITLRLTPARAEGADLEEALILPAGATIEQTRSEVAQSIMRLLFEALKGTPHMRAFSLAVAKRSNASLSGQRDPWNYWVFSPEFAASGEASRGSLWANGSLALGIRRSTEKSKIRIYGSYGRLLSGFRFEDGRWISGDIYAWKARALHGFSLGKRTSIGTVVQANGSQYENLEGHVHAAPLFEFNFFPYSDNAQKAVRITYQAGPWANFYIEPNIDSKMQELRPYHAVSLVVDVNQAWGSVQWIGQFNQFLDDPELFRVSSGAIVSLRLAEGLAFNLKGQGAFIQDLINLRGRDLTDEELVLYTVQQATDFFVTWEGSFSYTFGSIHNTIVNPRFGRIDLEEE